MVYFETTRCKVVLLFRHLFYACLMMVNFLACRGVVSYVYYCNSQMEISVTCRLHGHVAHTILSELYVPGSVLLSSISLYLNSLRPPHGNDLELSGSNICEPRQLQTGITNDKSPDVFAWPGQVL